MENLMRAISNFIEADMSYQHLGGYVEGHKVWYQPWNGNAWLDPAAVLCQHGQSVWLHSHGDVRKVATFHVKPYELVDGEIVKYDKSELKKRK